MLGERAASLDWMQKQRMSVFNLAQRSQNQAFGKDADEGLLAEDDMGVRVGDNVSHHYHAPPTPTPPTEKKSSMLPVALAALLGAGSALAAPAVVDYLKGDKTVDTDTDTRTELEFYRPKE